MKVLLVGEFSGVAENFEFALTLLGCTVSKIQIRDGYKGIGEGALFDLIHHVPSLRRERFDIAVFFTPLIARLALPSFYINSFIRERSEICYYLPCTSDPIWLTFEPEVPDYRRPVLGFIRDNDYFKYRNFRRSYVRHTERFLSKMDRILPLAYDYDAPFRGLEKYAGDLISFPYRIKDMGDEDLERTRKYKAYHGITRPGFKGSKIINQFMFNNFDSESRLVTKKIAFSDFRNNLRDAEIYFDQVFSKAPAYAALVAMNFCPTVVTGHDRTSTRSEAAAPVVDFLTELDMIEIEQELTYGVRMERNLQYLRQCHDPKQVAERLLNYG